MPFSTQITSEDPFLLDAFYAANNLLKSAVTRGGNQQNPHTGYDLPLLQSSGGFHFLDVLFLLHSDSLGQNILLNL